MSWFDSPIARTFPSRLRSRNACQYSSTAVRSSAGQCIWYRSIPSTRSRRSDASTLARRLAGCPARRGASVRSAGSQTRPALVNTYGRSASGSPAATTSSECPSPFTAAVSIQLTPDSTAWRIAAIDSASSWSPQA